MTAGALQLAVPVASAASELGTALVDSRIAAWYDQEAAAGLTVGIALAAAADAGQDAVFVEQNSVPAVSTAAPAVESGLVGPVERIPTAQVADASVVELESDPAESVATVIASSAEVSVAEFDSAFAPELDSADPDCAGAEVASAADSAVAIAEFGVARPVVGLVEPGGPELASAADSVAGTAEVDLALPLAVVVVATAESPA